MPYRLPVPIVLLVLGLIIEYLYYEFCSARELGLGLMKWVLGLGGIRLRVDKGGIRFRVCFVCVL